MRIGTTYTTVIIFRRTKISAGKLNQVAVEETARI